MFTFTDIPLGGMLKSEIASTDFGNLVRRSIIDSGMGHSYGRHHILFACASFRKFGLYGICGKKISSWRRLSAVYVLDETSLHQDCIESAWTYNVPNRVNVYG